MIQVDVKRKVGQQEISYRVELHGYDRLTPRAARGAVEVAFGGCSTPTTVWNGYGGKTEEEAEANDYGYRVYANSARKLYPDYSDRY